MNKQTFVRLCNEQAEHLIEKFTGEFEKRPHPDIHLNIHKPFLVHVKRIKDIYSGQFDFASIENLLALESPFKYIRKVRKADVITDRHQVMLLGNSDLNTQYRWFNSHIKKWMEETFDMSDKPKKAWQKGLPPISQMSADQIRLHHYDLFRKMGKAIEMHLEGTTKETIVEFLGIPKDRYDQALTFYYGERPKRKPSQAKSLQ